MYVCIHAGMLRSIYLLCWIGFCCSLTELPGDGKPFGFNDRPIEHVPIETHDLSPKDFFHKYVFEKKAVLLKGAVRNTPAVKNWSDKYFLNIPNDEIPEEHQVLVESRKKENRKAESVHMSLKAFVEIYNHTDQYMVDRVPSFLKSDVHLPFAIQCEQTLSKAAVDTFMWFSSGGTKSVVHTDSVENLNCLIRGEKQFIFVPPEFKEKVTIDHPEGSYSDIDVDAVDYSKYPGLAEVEYQYVDMVAGDCLYIPYKWIHQVRSYNRNIAVNLWWDTSKNVELNVDSCNQVYDESITLEDFKSTGFDVIDLSPAVIKDHLLEQTEGSKELSEERFLILLMASVFEDVETYKNEYFQLPSVKHLKAAFNIIDKSNDGKISSQDVEAVSNDDWIAIVGNFITHKQMAEKEADKIYGGNEEDSPEVPADKNTDNDKDEL